MNTNTCFDGQGQSIPGDQILNVVVVQKPASEVPSDSISEEEARRQREEVGVSTVPIPGQPQLAGSSWQSLYRGLGSIETDYLNGEIALLGQLHDIPTPYNRALQHVANRMARQGQKPGTLTLADLEAEVAALTRK